MGGAAFLTSLPPGRAPRCGGCRLVRHATSHCVAESSSPDSTTPTITSAPRTSSRPSRPSSRLRVRRRRLRVVRSRMRARWRRLRVPRCALRVPRSRFVAEICWLCDLGGRRCAPEDASHSPGRRRRSMGHDLRGDRRGLTVLGAGVHLIRGGGHRPARAVAIAATPTMRRLPTGYRPASPAVQTSGRRPFTHSTPTG